VQNGVSYNWCFYISYIGVTQNTKFSTKKKIDYMQVLDTETFAIFSKLREIRKQIAVKHAVSAYIVFTDAELAEIAKLKKPNVNNIRNINGVGDKKAEKYGAELLEQYHKEKQDETSRQLNTKDIPF
jgi:superfamily II DNA helicase RecQ